MKERSSWPDFLLKSLSYILVAAIASTVTLAVCLGTGAAAPSKLEQLETLIQEKFINEVDQTALEDGAAAGMVTALGDRWSYYIPADQYDAHMEQMNNAYVGIGITITVRADGLGFDIKQVEPNGSAKEAGILPGDILTAVEGQSADQIGTDGARDLIRGKEGTDVTITVLRDGQTIDFTMTRKTIQVQVASGEMLKNGIGLVTIANFDSRCADETIAAIEKLLEQGATALIFDVRNNPGGYKTELVKVLDYLLPEGPLFRSLSYDGKEEVDSSDKNCLSLPMAVLINGNSYSAAEFFAAALEEYDWAVTVGDPTVGKGYFQSTYQFTDGSAVGLSIGKYFTPEGVSLADVGGLVPGIPVEVDEETAAKIYGKLLDPAEDPQIQAAAEALKTEK